MNITCPLDIVSLSRVKESSGEARVFGPEPLCLRVQVNLRGQRSPLFVHGDDDTLATLLNKGTTPGRKQRIVLQSRVEGMRDALIGGATFETTTAVVWRIGGAS
jgi:hypothetical protein